MVVLTKMIFFTVVTGSVSLDELMTGLMSAHETFQQAMDVEIREEVALFYLVSQFLSFPCFSLCCSEFVFSKIGHTKKLVKSIEKVCILKQKRVIYCRYYC